jgi:hypothetical protein
MSVDERRRSALFQAAAQALGEDHAVTMFELLPPPETDLATRADLDLLEERLGARMDGLAARMDGLDARVDRVESNLHARIDDVERNLHARLDAFEAGMRTEMALLREEMLSAFRAELVSAIAGQTRGIVVAIIAAIIAAVIGIGGLAVTLSQLL